MVKTTYKRTAVFDGKIAKCIFIVQCELYRKFNVVSSKNEKLQNALKNQDFKTYLKIVSS